MLRCGEAASDETRLVRLRDKRCSTVTEREEWDPAKGSHHSHRGSKNSTATRSGTSSQRLLPISAHYEFIISGEESDVVVLVGVDRVLVEAGMRFAAVEVGSAILP